MEPDEILIDWSDFMRLEFFFFCKVCVLRTQPVEDEGDLYECVNGMWDSFVLDPTNPPRNALNSPNEFSSDFF